MSSNLVESNTLHSSAPHGKLEQDNYSGLDSEKAVVEVGPEDVPRSEYTYQETRKLLRKVDFYILPLLMLSYLLKNMDSNMISYVKIMNSGKDTNALKQLGMTTDDWAWTSTAFTIPFMLLEVPSNLLLKWSTPRLHFVRIIFFWSVATACQAACTNKAGLLTARAFMGAFEAGLLPGIFVQLTTWYRPDEISLRMVLISQLGQFSGILCALLAYGLAYIDGRGGLSGWQWAFVIEGIMGIVLCGALYMFLPDYPDSPASRRQFLTPHEGAFLVNRLPPNSAKSTDKNFSMAEFKAAMKDPLTWGFSFMMLFEQTGTTGYTWWLPTIIAGFGFTTTQSSQLLNIPPAVVYVIATLTMAYTADHAYRVPRPVWQLIAMVMLIGFFVGLTVLTTDKKAGLYTLIILTSIPHAAFQAIIYPWRSQTVRGSTYVATAFAFQNSVGQLAGIFAPQIFRAKYAPRYTTPFIVCIVFLCLTIFATLFTWYHSREVEAETRRIARERRDIGKNTGEVIQKDLTIIDKIDK